MGFNLLRYQMSYRVDDGNRAVHVLQRGDTLLVFINSCLTFYIFIFSVILSILQKFESRLCFL